MSPPIAGYKKGRQTYAICKIDDFEFVESQTNEFLRLTHKKRPRDMQFMYFVQLALEGKPLPEAESTVNSGQIGDKLKKKPA